MKVNERLRAALLIVVLVLAAPWVVEEALSAQRDAFVLQALADSQEATLTSEFVSFDSYESVRMQEDLGVCSFESGLSAPETLTRICADLEGKGWTCVSSDQVNNACLAKDDGVYGWAYVSCGSIDGTTVAVCNIARRD